MTQLSAGDAINQLNRTEIGGVPAVWVPGRPEVLRVSLCFRAGMTDLDLPRHGWLHLLEHLALHGRDGISLQVNGEVSLLGLRFDAAGDPAEVTAFFRELCAWLADPQLGDLEHEARVLRAESGQRPVGATARHLLWRYGARGPGVAAYEEFGLHRVAPIELIALARSVFTAGNAICALNGEPPSGLELPLSAGPRRPVPLAVPCEQIMPAAFRDPVGGVGLSGLVDRSTAATVFHRVLSRELQKEIRHSTGTGYSAWSDYESVDAESAVITAGIDVLLEARSGLTGRVTRLVRRLAEQGVAESELAEELLLIRRSMREDPRAYWKPWAAARAELSGLSSDPDGYDAELAAVTVDDIRRVAQQLSRTLLIGIDAGTNPETLPLLDCPTVDTVPDGGSIHPALNKQAGEEQIRFSGGAAHLRRDRRFISAEPATAAAVLARPDGRRTIIRPDGYQLDIEPTLWRDGAGLVRAVDEATPEPVRVPLPSRPADQIPRPPATRRSWDLDRIRSLFDGTVAQLFVGLLIVGGVVAAVVDSHAQIPPIAPIVAGGLLLRLLAAQRHKKK